MHCAPLMSVAYHKIWKTSESLLESSLSKAISVNKSFRSWFWMLSETSFACCSDKITLWKRIPCEPLDDQAIGNVPSLGNRTNWFDTKLIVGQLEYTIQQQHDYQNNSKQSRCIKGGNGPLVHCSYNNLVVEVVQK